jgi:hypothetical protein
VGEKKLAYVFCDNQSAIDLCHNPKYQSHLSIFEVKHHFIKKLVAQKDLQIIFCGTEDMKANVLTKSLGKIKHLRFKSELKVHENRNSTSTSSFLEEKVMSGLNNIKFN